MTHRIYFSVCGEGYGHSSRDLAIAKVLRRNGANVLMGGYGYVLNRLREDFDCVEIRREFEMVGDSGAFDLKATISKSKSSAFHFSKIISEERKIIQDFNATCVVTDGRTAAIFAAFKLGIPCIAISNQTSLEPFFIGSKHILRLIGKTVEFTSKTSISFAEEVLIPDFLPPDTVCLNTLSKSWHVMKKQHFVGPVTSINVDKIDVDNSFSGNLLNMDRPLILVLLGGHSYRRPIFTTLLDMAHRLPDANFLIFTKFTSDSYPDNVKVETFVKDIFPYLKASDLIITQAGHSTAMEILTLGKTSLIIPDKGQIEQENNAARMKELRVCETLDYDSLTPDALFDTIYMLLNEPGYGEMAKHYSKIVQEMKGDEKAAKIILELSNRLQVY
ncbi:MAG: UDP-N-acetylglucosamine--N-acetylmuramyl-(pentapeptide) pyrophosphoryl-undecaprenol N-acetylglucosamine transferase [Methanosarcinaceae archaeon]